MSGIITGFTAIKNSEECKIFPRSKKVSDLLDFQFLKNLCHFRRNDPCPMGRHHWNNTIDIC